MKLLFDQNISFRLIAKLHEQFPEAKQVRELGLENHTDREIWKYAKDHGYSIVTFDADFSDLATLLNHPPKIVWLRTGNTTTDFLAQFLVNKKELIEEFINEDQYAEIACLELE